METKQIIAVAAILAVALAGIGAAYAYTATLENDSNTADTEYLAISVAGTPAVTSYSETFSQEDLRFNTKTYWNADAETPAQVINYKPSSATHEATTIDGKVAVLLGSELALTIDSSLMGEGKLFSFSASTPAAPLSSIGAFVFWYQLGTEEGYVVMDAAATGDPAVSKEVFFYSDAIQADTSLKLKLYAIEVDSATLIPKADLSFEEITFTFVAEVDETMTYAPLTVKTQDNAATPAGVAVNSISMVTAAGVPVFAQNTVTDTGVYTYASLPAVPLTLDVKKDNVFMKAENPTITPAASAEITFSEAVMVGAKIVDGATIEVATNVAAWTDVPLGGLKVQGNFGTTENPIWLDMTDTFAIDGTGVDFPAAGSSATAKLKVTAGDALQTVITIDNAVTVERAAS